jgi:hypothetical protein
MSEQSERMLRAAMKDQYRDMQAEIERLQGLLTRIHGIAAEPRPVNMAVRLENIACIASGERDATYAQVFSQHWPRRRAPAGCNHFPGQVNCEWCTEVPHE